ncbi:MAG: glycosyltransferase family 2 protein [Vicinamibacterales bacterium]
MKTVALVPAYNEAGTIAAVVSGVRPLVDRVLVVDDGSTDGTERRALSAGADVLRQPVNAGKGSAIRAGLIRLFEGDFSHVLFLDGDLQHRPEEAAMLIEAAGRTAADLVIGERQFRRDAMPASRYWANRIGSRALSAFVGAPIRDTQCGYRVARLEPLRLLRLRATGYEIETEILIKLRRHGARVVGVPVSAVYTGQASKLRPVRDTTKTCFLAVYYRYLERL